MGYHTNPSMVEENKTILTSILAAITRGEGIHFSVDNGANISTEQWRLRRILAATDYHPEVCGGVFAGLGQKCTIRVEMDTLQLNVIPKAVGRKSQGSKLSMTEVVPTEMDMISKLRDPGHTENLTILSFEPSQIYEINEFTTALDDIGWKLHPKTVEIEGNKIHCVVERCASDEPTGFDILNQ